LNDWFHRQGGRDRLWPKLLGLDSKIGSACNEAWSRSKDIWNAGTSFFARFQLLGWRRLLNEGLSEIFSLATGAFIVLYAAALPALLEFDESKFSTGKFAVKFLDANGNELGKRGILHNDSVALDDIPDVLIKATLATEDRRFFDHYGVDVWGTMRAIATNAQANEVVQGGSTLTQQLAKNLFLSSERSLQRKVKELFLSFLLESRLTKRDILKLYFDRAYMGGGAVGVEAAAQYYFGKSVRDVTMPEAALMAGLYKAPTKYAPHVNLAASRARTNTVLDNLVEAGFYTAGQVQAARLNPAKTIDNRSTTSPDWFLDWAYDEVQRLMEGKGQYVLTARTTVDMSLQRLSDETIISAVAKEGKVSHFNSAAMVVMETDGAVKAITGGLDYGESQFNRATKAKRQPGSSFKVYVYAAALENGYTSETIVRDAFTRPCPPRGWTPQNFGGGGGTGQSMPLWQALAKSYNTVAAELSSIVGRDKVIEMTKRLGIAGVKRTCSMALGDGGITVMEHTGGIATFANNGKLAKPYGILDITTSKGELLYSRDRDEPPAPQVLKPKVAEQMNIMLQKVVTEGTATRSALDFTNAAGKTGTSSGPKDVWFVGFTGKYVAGVWAGNDDNHPMLSGSEHTGGHIASPIWHNFMSVAHTDMNIPKIPGLELHPTQVAELARLAEVKKAEAAAGINTTQTTTNADGTTRAPNAMPDQTRDALKKLAVSLRKAGNLGDAPPPPAAAPSAAPAGTPPKPGAPAAPTAPAPAATPSTQGALDPKNQPRNSLQPTASTASAKPGEAAKRGIP
jgi:penicillin-binding protein 1A